MVIYIFFNFAEWLNDATNGARIYFTLANFIILLIPAFPVALVASFIVDDKLEGLSIEASKRRAQRKKIDERAQMQAELHKASKRQVAEERKLVVEP